MNYDSCRILLVDDNPLNQKLLRLTLARYGFNIELADNGEQAIELYLNNKYDLVLMDVMMPGMDGIETTQRIREIEVESGNRTFIFGLSANTMDSDRKRCLESGMDEYLVKPFNVDDFLRAIELVGVIK
jgi:CheY-like chemotaxis protein